MEPTPKPFNSGTRVIPLKYPFMERGDHPIATTVSHFESVKNRRKQKTWVPSASLHLTASKNVLLFLPFQSRWPSRGRRSLRGALHNSLSYLWVIFPFCSFFLLTGFSFTSSSTWFFWFCYSGLPGFFKFTKKTYCLNNAKFMCCSFVLEKN